MSPELEYVEVQLELGHRAVLKSKVGPDNYTHNWTLFVQGPDDCKIDEFVEKVVFNLHESFAKPRRSFREPPFEVKESGYAGFELPIDIYFKNKEDPKKITYVYDLFLHVNDSVHNTRREKLTFQNPSADFKKKLLRAGGKCYPDPKEKTGCTPAGKQKLKPAVASPAAQASYPPASPRAGKSVLKAADSHLKIHQHRIPQKDIPSHPPVSSTTPAVSFASSSAKQIRDKPAIAKLAAKPDPFTDLFGPPLQSRPSPEPGKQKEKGKKVKSDNGVQTKVKSEKNDAGHSSKRPADAASSVRSSRLSSPSHSHPPGEDTSSKRSKEKKKKEKEFRSSSDSSRDSHRDTPVHSESARKSDSKARTKIESNDDKKAKMKGKDIRSVASGATGASNSSQKSKDVKKENVTSTTISYSNNNNTGTTTLEIKSVKKEKTWDSESKKSKSKEFTNEALENESGPCSKAAPKASKERSSKETSSSPLSIGSDLQSVPNGAPANGSLGDLSSPLSSLGSTGVGKASRKKKKHDSGNDSDDLTRDKKWKATSEGDEENRSVRRENYLTELLWVQKRINETTDPILLQRVVDMIESSTIDFEVTKNSFDFDLLRLDDATLSKLREIVDKG